MSDDHQLLLVARPSKSLVTLGTTGSPRRLVATFSPLGSSVTTKPAPTFSARTDGRVGSGRGSIDAGPHAAAKAKAIAPITAVREITSPPIPCEEPRGPCAWPARFDRSIDSRSLPSPETRFRRSQYRRA